MQGEIFDIYSGVKVLTGTGEVFDIQQIHFKDSRISKIVANNQEQDISTSRIFRDNQVSKSKPKYTEEYNNKLSTVELPKLNIGYFDGMYMQGWILMEGKGAVCIPSEDLSLLKEYKSILESLEIPCSAVYVHGVKSYYLVVKEN